MMSIQRARATRSAISAAGLLVLAACGGGGGGGSNSAPQNLSFAREIALYTVGLEIPDNSPSVSGSINSWSVTPPLPAGLALDPASGAISGTPTVLTGARNYVVRASNSAGFTEATVRLAVVRPAFVAVACSAVDGSLTSYAVDAETGAMRPTGYEPAPAGAQAPRSIATHPTLDVLYAAQSNSNHVSVFDFDRATGRMSARANVATTGNRPEEVVLHPSGEALYVLSKQGAHVQTFSVDPLDGGLTSVGTLSLGSNGLEAVARNADGSFMWISNAVTTSMLTLEIDAGTLLPSIVGAPLPTTNKLRSLALSPDERFLYGASSDPGSSTVDVFSIDPLTGALTKFDSVTVGAFAVSVAIEPTGRFLYVSVSSNDTIRVFEIDPLDGTLAVPADPLVATIHTGARPAAISIDAAGSRMFVTELNGWELATYAIDYDTGGLERLGANRTREQPQLLAVFESDTLTTPRTTFAYVGNEGSSDVSIFSAAPTTGELTLVEAGLPVGGEPGTLARHPDGRWLYAADATNGTVRGYSVDPLSGDLSPIGMPVGAGIQPAAAEVDPSGRYLYVASRGSHNVTAMSIDAANGTLTHVGQYPTGLSQAPSALAIDPTGRFVLVANEQGQSLSIFDLDPATGELSTSLAPLALAGEPSALAIHPSGGYVLATLGDTGELALFSLAALDGAVAHVQTVACGLDPASVAVRPDGAHVYVANSDAVGIGNVASCSFDVSAGTLSSVDNFLAGTHPVDIAVDPSGAYLYVVNQGSNDVTRMTIDELSGAPSAASFTLAGVSPGTIEVLSKLE